MPTTNQAPVPYLERHLITEPVTILSARRLEATEEARAVTSSAAP
jgi:hypothetical protein